MKPRSSQQKGKRLTGKLKGDIMTV